MISVCLATYNGEAYIGTQLESILAQLGPHDEVIISDDCSTDRTIDLAESYEDRRVLILANPKKGIITNFENALAHAKGDYIFLSDQDDIWKPNKVSHCIKAFESGYNLVVSDCDMFESESKKVVEHSFYAFNKSKSGFLQNIVHNSFIGCCMAFDRQVLELALPFPKNLPMHDSWIGLLSEVRFKTKFLDEKLISYRIHSGNASATGVGISSYSFAQKLGFRWSLIISVINRLLR